MARARLKIVLPIVVLIAGAAAAAILTASRRAPPRLERSSPGPLVEVVRVSVEDVAMKVTGHGEVVAKVAVDVVPQVAGKVIHAHPSLVAGGFFEADQPLIEIDPEDYELAVDRAEAAVARAEVNKEREQAEAEVARQEWDELHPDEEPPSGLVVHEPQVRQAEAELAAARADLNAASLNLERTRVSVPFDGVVVSKSVDVGQYVAPGRAVARVYGRDTVEVRVPFEDRELAWFDVPMSNGDEGPSVEVSANFRGRRHTWDGRVVRMEAQVDSASRMVHVVVEVKRPYSLSGEGPSLLPGTFVDVQVSGKTLHDVIQIPRYAVHEGNQVWVVEDGVLRIREVVKARSDRETVYVTAGVEHGDQVVVTVLEAVTDGMKVRIAGAESDEADLERAAGDTVAALDPRFSILDSRWPPAHPLKWNVRRDDLDPDIEHRASSIRA
jgi:RND family efflux transporter MFP subunit